MKPLKLTKEHKSKLLEMCKVLFPEWNSYSFYITEDEYYQQCDDLGLLHFTGHKIKGVQGYLVIHWFEFCCNILVNELFDSSFDFGKIYYELLTSNHPVDYLYEEFKKLK